MTSEPDAKEPEKAPGARVLVRDDELIVQQFLTGVLTEEGHEVEIIHNDIVP